MLNAGNISDSIGVLSGQNLPSRTPIPSKGMVVMTLSSVLPDGAIRATKYGIIAGAMELLTITWLS